MKIGLVTDSLGKLSFSDMLKTCRDLGIEQIELACGNWSTAPHIDLDGLLDSPAKRDEMKGMLKDYGLSISAFNCSGNPLAPGEWGERETAVTHKTFKLAEYFDIHTVVMMSGLPAGGPEDKYPNWVIMSWPKETGEMLKYQWEEVALPFWKENIKIANSHGINKIALEPHGRQLVYSAESFQRLRDGLNGDQTVGFNMDPSHLFWMGADPIAITQAFGDAIYHVHIKDVRIEGAARFNTILDDKDVLQYAERSWNFCIPGFGHSELWWHKFIAALKMAGYDGILSIEHEDYTLDTMKALACTVNMLKSSCL